MPAQLRASLKKTEKFCSTRVQAFWDKRDMPSSKLNSAEIMKTLLTLCVSFIALSAFAQQPPPPGNPPPAGGAPMNPAQAQPPGAQQPGAPGQPPGVPGQPPPGGMPPGAPGTAPGIAAPGSSVT